MRARDREQFGEPREGSVKWTIDCERDVPCAVSDLKMPFDQFRSARKHVSRRRAPRAAVELTRWRRRSKH